MHTSTLFHVISYMQWHLSKVKVLLKCHQLTGVSDLTQVRRYSSDVLIHRFSSHRHSEKQRGEEWIEMKKKNGVTVCLVFLRICNSKGSVHVLSWIWGPVIHSWGVMENGEGHTVT